MTFETKLRIASAIVIAYMLGRLVEIWRLEIQLQMLDMIPVPQGVREPMPKANADAS